MNLRRLLTPLLSAALLVVLPVPARAGSYVVRACAGDAVNNSWWAAAHSGLTAYTQCPAADYDGVATGLVARSTQNGNGGSVPVGAGAWQEFDAPAGAGLSSISFQASSGRPSGCWALGLYGWSEGDPNSAWHAWGFDADCNATGGGWSYYIGPYTVDLGGVAHARMGIRCDSWGGCPTTSSIPAWANLKDVAVTVVDDSPPVISANSGALWTDGWLRGRAQAWATFSDNVGIRHIYGQVDDDQPFSWHEFNDPGWPAEVRCDYSRSRPCQDIPNGGVGVDTATVGDGQHRLRVAAIDAAGNRGSVERTIRVDNHAPAPPGDVAVAGGEGWRRANGFAVGWANPPGQASPIVRAHWRLCRAEGPGDCTTGEREGDGIHALDGLRAAGTGDYTLALWLEDGAGNQDSSLASQPVHLRLDEIAPRSPGFDAPDAADPRRLALPVSDEGSGVADAAIQVRRRPDGDWRSLPTELRDGRAWTQVPDLELPDGPYDVRALVRDAAGNQTTVSADASGRPMGIVLPVRTPTRLTAAGRLRLGFGKSGRLVGRLATAQERPVAHASVAVLARVAPGRDFRRAGAVQTDGEGRFTAPVPAGPSRTIRFAFGGDDLLLPVARDARVLVPAAATLRASRRRVRNGRSVTFRGRLLGGPIPPRGRTVDLQAHYRGAWRTFATPRTDRRGRFRLAYRFGATVGRVVYRFRALVKPDAAYPYEAGHSPTVRVTVFG